MQDFAQTDVEISNGATFPSPATTDCHRLDTSRRTHCKASTAADPYPRVFSGPQPQDRRRGRLQVRVPSRVLLLVQGRLIRVFLNGGAKDPKRCPQSILDVALTSSPPKKTSSAELNDGEAKVPASFAKSLAGKFAGVKTNAVLKLTDVRYAENKAFVTEFEFVEDSEAEFVSDASDAQASKKQKTAEGATATVTTSPTGSGKKTMSIASLNPYMGNWCVKAKLSLKGDVRTFRNAKGEGKVMTIELVDEAGTAIQATMWKDAIDSYDSILEVGKVFYVAKGTLRPANKQYSNCSNDYEMSLDGRCEIEVCTDSVDMSKMQRGYELVKIDSLAMKIGGRGSVDVLAVVQTVGELGAVRRKSDNEEIQRRDVTLVDDTGKSISLTLWNALAVEQGEQLSQMTNPIIAVRGLRVTDYNGKYFPITTFL
jgi:replication factor A1